MRSEPQGSRSLPDASINGRVRGGRAQSKGDGVQNAPWKRRPLAHRPSHPNRTCGPPTAGDAGAEEAASCRARLRDSTAHPYSRHSRAHHDHADALAQGCRPHKQLRIDTESTDSPFKTLLDLESTQIAAVGASANPSGVWTHSAYTHPVCQLPGAGADVAPSHVAAGAERCTEVSAQGWPPHPRSGTREPGNPAVVLFLSWPQQVAEMQAPESPSLCG